MKETFAYLLSWSLYWIGDTACKIMQFYDDSERWVGFWYPIYNWFMIKSDAVQSWVDGTSPRYPWGQPQS